MGKEEDRQQLTVVIAALERVDLAIRQEIYKMSLNMSRDMLVQSFNQRAKDMFSLLERISRACGRYETTDLAANRSLFNTAVTTSPEIAVNKFTLLVLEFAPEIYARDEEAFLKMTIPETDVKTSAGWGVIRSNEFRDMWVHDMTGEMKTQVTELMIRMVTIAQAFLYQTIRSN